MIDFLTKMVGTAKRIRKGVTLTLVEDIVMPWYKANGDEAKYDAYEMRHHVADRVHEALGGLVWAVRNMTGVAGAEYMVYSVEPFQSEDGGYTLMVSLRQKDMAEPEEPVEGNPHEPTELALHAFLQMFEPVGEIEFTEYHS